MQTKIDSITLESAESMLKQWKANNPKQVYLVDYYRITTSKLVAVLCRCNCSFDYAIAELIAEEGDFIQASRNLLNQ